jgi:hypothetical protein
MKTYGGVEIKHHALLTWVLDRAEWSAWSPGRFNLEEHSSGTHPTRGWVCPRVCLGTMVKREISAPTWNRTPIPSRPACSLITILTETRRLSSDSFLFQNKLRFSVRPDQNFPFHRIKENTKLGEKRDAESRINSIQQESLVLQRRRIARLVKKFSAFYGTWRSSAMIASGRTMDLTMSQVIQWPSTHYISFRSITIILSSLSPGRFYSVSRAVLLSRSSD